MTRALVIRTAGDEQIAGAIVAGMTEATEYRELRAELARLKEIEARDAVRRYGDEKRWERTRRRLARKYYVKPAGPVYGAILGLWAGLWMVVIEALNYVHNCAEQGRLL